MRTNVIALVVAVVASLMLSAQAQSQSRTVFAGVPSVRVVEGGAERHLDTIRQNQAMDFHCVVSEIEGRYYWATRENKPLLRHVSGAFVTYVAIDGSGYVRIIDPSAKGAASLMSPAEATFDYVEHLLLGLQSVTYYGSAQ